MQRNADATTLCELAAHGALPWIVLRKINWPAHALEN